MIHTLRRLFWLFRMRNKHLIRDFNRVIRPTKTAGRDGLTIHILVTSRREYINAGIKCAQSFLDFNPNSKIMYYVDSANLHYLKRKIRRKLPGFKTEIEIVSSEKRWQEHKLNIILNKLSSTDIFCDADLYWNGTPDISLAPFGFVKEFILNVNPTFNMLLNHLGISERNYPMINTSVVALGEYANHKQLAEQTKKLYERILESCSSPNSQISQIEKISRLSEQLALSIALTEVVGDNLHFLKFTDSPMDGGIAESYYLGTTKGWA